MSEVLMSAIICTHNRADYLGAAIDSLLAQTFEAAEVIVIDNASTDATKAVVAQRQPHPRLRYVHEPTLGLSAARNRGAQEAAGALLAYLDDDAEASPGWLEALYRVFEQDAHVAIAGGKVTLLWPPDITSPNWLSATLAESLGSYDLGDTLKPITTPNLTPRGLNYAIRKSFLDSLGGFDVQLGRVGKNLLSNEELHMTQLALQQGWRVMYVPDALAAHNVAPERVRRQWFLQRSWWQGISECYREQLAQPITVHSLQNRSLCMLRGLVKAGRNWHDPALCFENLVYAYGQLGYVLKGLRSFTHQA